MFDNKRLLAIEKKVEKLNNQLGNMVYDMREVARSEITAGSTVIDVSQMQYGLYTALCIDTLDIWKQNRIRFYSPLFHKPDRKSTRLNSSHSQQSRMPSSA